MLLPDSWVVHFWDMAIRWLAVYYFITVRRSAGRAAGRPRTSGTGLRRHAGAPARTAVMPGCMPRRMQERHPWDPTLCPLCACTKSQSLPAQPTHRTEHMAASRRAAASPRAAVGQAGPGARAQVPIDIAFWAKARLGAWFAALNLAADLLLMADVALHFFRAYVSVNSVLVTSLPQIRRQYLGARPGCCRARTQPGPALCCRRPGGASRRLVCCRAVRRLRARSGAGSRLLKRKAAWSGP